MSFAPGQLVRVRAWWRNDEIVDCLVVRYEHPGFDRQLVRAGTYLVQPLHDPPTVSGAMHDRQVHVDAVLGLSDWQPPALARQSPAAGARYEAALLIASQSNDRTALANMIEYDPRWVVRATAARRLRELDVASTPLIVPPGHNKP